MQDRTGDLWVARSNSPVAMEPGASKDFSSELHGSKLLTGIEAMAQTPDGT